MLPAHEKWFSEVCQRDGLALSWRIETQLAHAATDLQTIEVYQTSDWGRLMALDGRVRLTTRDNFLYHEMLTHPALFSHPDPRRVVIIGGGDCGCLKVVLALCTVRSCTQVEIDEQVTRLAEQHFPELCERNQDPRARLLFADGLVFVHQLPAASVDVIIIDSTDPIGPPEGLFGPAFIADCYRALADGGILVQHSQSPLLHQELIQGVRARMLGAGFADVHTLGFPQPCYPSGWWSVTLAGKSGRLQAPDSDRFAHSGIQTRYYSPAVQLGGLLGAG